MSSRKVHLAGSALLWLITFLIYYFVGGLYIEISLQKNAMWIMTSFLLAVLGGEMADWDLIWQRGLPHRNIITHSIFLPSLICIPLIWINQETIHLLPLYAFFLIGYSSHLILDLFGTKKWRGSACIRFYWLKGERHRTAGRFFTQFWLLLNGALLFIIGVGIMFTYHLWVM